MLPHDLASRYVAPQIRALVAHRLSARGLSQEKIAALMGMSQPMVSKYLRQGLEAVLAKLQGYGVDTVEAEAVADTLAVLLERGEAEAYRRLLYSYMNTLLMRGDLCRLHRTLDKGIPSSCDMCSRLFQPLIDPLLKEVDEAVKVFVSTPGMEDLVPNVGSNIVAAKPSAKTIMDVVGLTGGIFRTRGGLSVVGKPSYGGSRHTASVLLAVARRWPRLRAAVVLAYRNTCIEALEEAGMSVARSGPHSSPEEQLSRLSEAVEHAEEQPDAVADAGGYGLEPVIYVFGPSAIKAVEKAATCVE